MIVSTAAAESLLDDLASRVDVWKPGHYAGSLYAQFAEAAASIARVNDADRAFQSERLARLADRAGVLLAPSHDRSTPIAVVKVAGTLTEVAAALEPLQPGIVVREAASGAFTLWCDRVPAGQPPAPWLVAEIEMALKLFRTLGVFERYVLLPST